MSNFRLSRSPLALMVAVPLLASLPAPLLAPPAAAQATSGCDAQPRRNIGRSILGRALGDVVGRATGSLGGAARFIPSAEVADTLTEAIACRLDPQEQQQAAEATVEATRGDQVGATSEWTSGTRNNVSGRSVVTQRTANGDGSSCMMVDDIIIVEGEETRVSKRMCRVPPSARYVLAA